MVSRFKNLEKEIGQVAVDNILDSVSRFEYLSQQIHTLNKKWWCDLDTGEPIKRNVGELLMLCVSELSEAMEGHRKSLKDDKLPHRDMFEVEIADVFIRLLDLSAGMNLNIGGAILEKLEFNVNRADHKKENRMKKGGKKY